MAESYKQLYEVLIETELGCVPAGFQETAKVYEYVKEEYPDLCDDGILCQDVCGTDSKQPEWKHRVRTVQQDLGRDAGTRVQNLSKGWYYAPEGVEIEPIPEKVTDLEVGTSYNRWELHDEFGGQRYRGIATPADYPAVFIFTGDSGEAYGYEDEFQDDGSFWYTGEGAEGDMEMEDGNAAIREHRSHNESLHLFEDTEHPWIVNYVGQYEYVRHDWQTLQDKEDNEREAIRFKLEPVGGTEIEIEGGTPSSLSTKELFEKAKASSPTESTPSQGSSSSGDRRSYKRSEVVKEFARRQADGVCQGCEEPAPFIDKNGEPFLEVHHLHRRSDGGADDPENVIALCPNCHRRVHQGEDGTEFNQALVEKAAQRNEKLQTQRL